MRFWCSRTIESNCSGRIFPGAEGRAAVDSITKSAKVLPRVLHILDDFGMERFSYFPSRNPVDGNPERLGSLEPPAKGLGHNDFLSPFRAPFMAASNPGLTPGATLLAPLRGSSPSFATETIYGARSA